MQTKRLYSMVLAFILFAGTLATPVSALEARSATSAKFYLNIVTPLATNSFSMSIPAQTDALANNSFSLAAGETVTIKASYSPFSASMDFGLIAPNGVYYYFNITNGSIDKTIQVSESGDYILQIRNNSSDVGEVYRRSGDALNLYVAVAAATPKEDWDYEFDKGIKAWAFIYWIDNSGTTNELYGAAGKWDPQGLVLDNRQVWYGETDVFFSSWPSGFTLQFPTDDYEYYEDPGVYYGFVLGCQTRVDVMNVGTVQCRVTSGLLT